MNVNLNNSKDKEHKEGTTLLMLKKDKQDRTSQQPKQDDSSIIQ